MQERKTGTHLSLLTDDEAAARGVPIGSVWRNSNGFDITVETVWNDGLTGDTIVAYQPPNTKHSLGLGLSYFHTYYKNT